MFTKKNSAKDTLINIFRDMSKIASGQEKDCKKRVPRVAYIGFRAKQTHQKKQLYGDFKG